MQDVQLLSAQPASVAAVAPVMTVDDASFLTRLFGGETPYEQQFRELAVNSVEAAVAGKVKVEFGCVIRNGVPKLAVTDTGCGMTPDELVERFTHLASSGKIQSLAGNFGVGAKITAGVRNPAGLEVISKTASGARAYRVRLVRNADTFQLALFSSGQPVEIVPEHDVPDAVVLAGHGTQVVLWGETESEDTVATLIATLKTKGLTRYLNSRFYTLAQGVTLKTKVEISGRSVRSRTIVGQRELLMKAAEKSGVCQLDGGHISWFIATEDAVSAARDDGDVAGFVSALYQGELYCRFDGRSGLQMLRNFGISAGTSRVALVVAPDHVQSNAARTGLRRADGSEFTLDDLAEQFRANLPTEIIDLINEETAKADTNREAKLADRILKISMLFKLRGRRHGALPKPAAAKASSGTSVPRSRRNAPPRPPAGAGVDLPKCEWISHNSKEWCGERNRAAFYDAVSNKLLLNRDFGPLVTLIETIVDEFAGERGALAPAVRALAERHAQGWAELQAVEAVLNARTLAEAKGWDAETAAKLLTPEVFSIVLAGRYHTMGEVRKAVASQLR